MTTSTRSPEKLLAPGRLAPLCRSIAVLDLLLFPDDWESRYHSFTREWARGESTFSMRDGQGDHFTIWFPRIGGAAIRGFAHESPMSPWSSVRAKASKSSAKTDAKKKTSVDAKTIANPKKAARAKPNDNDEPEPWENIFAGLPKSLDVIRTEPSFGGSEVSFCMWWSRDHEMTWRVGDDLVFPSGNDPDGSAELLNILDGHAATYARWASDYCERKIPIDVVKKVYAQKPLSEADVVAINPDATLEDVREELTSLGYRIKGDAKPHAEKSAASAKNSPRASRASKASTTGFKSAAMLPIGVVRSSRAEVVDDLWDAETSRIELDSSRFDSESLQGLDTFSHAEIIYLLDRVEDSKIETGARHPRNNEDWPKVGIFAQRGKNRPNRIGSTVCKIAKVAGTTLHVKGLDAVDGTPVLDIKPWVKELGPRGATKQPKWITELMKRYWD